MGTGFIVERRAAVLASLFSAGCLGWSFFVDLQVGPLETCRVLAGLTALWLPIGGLVYLLLRERCSDGLTRFTLSAATSYGLTTPLYALCGVGGLALPGFQRVFYLAEALLLAGVLLFAVRRKLLWRAADLRQGWRRLDWALIALIALSILLTARFKVTVVTLPDQSSRKIVAHGDATYLASLAHELGRRTPAAQQAPRAGLKERAYHMFPHLTAMLIARYTGQADMLRALAVYQFTVVEVLLCLAFFCIVRRVTASAAAGYFAVALIYILAIPLPPVGRHVMPYFYFTTLPHATSSLEPAVWASPQMYCALPVIFGILLFVLQFSIQLSQRRAAGTLAILAGLMAAVSMRFRVQAFLILFPGLLLLLAIAWYRTRQWVFVAAGCLAALVVGIQAWEMRLPLYYPDTGRLVVRNNHLSVTCDFMNAWPGADVLRATLARHLGPQAFLHAWQIVCLSTFALANIAGIPLATAAGFHFLRRRTWQADAWAYSSLVAWLTIGTAIGSTCLSTNYDEYSVGGQSLFLVGWYLLPLAAIGIWQAAALLSIPLPTLRRHGWVAAALLLAGAAVWQIARPPSLLQEFIRARATIVSGEEWAALEYMRAYLPTEAITLTKVTHHNQNYCLLSSITGRRTFWEYRNGGASFSGGPADQPAGRQARIDRVWSADNPAEFSAALLDTGATHLIEYAEHPLPHHFSECLEEFWCGPTGQVKVWTFCGSQAAAPLARQTRPSDSYRAF